MKRIRRTKTRRIYTFLSRRRVVTPEGMQKYANIIHRKCIARVVANNKTLFFIAANS